MTSAAWPLWPANPGTEQRERLPPALAEGYFRVDERRLPDFVESGTALARHLPFFDLRNKPAGDWGDWFENDEALVLARFVGIDMERLEAKLLRDGGDAIEPRVLWLREFARRIYAWYTALKVMDRPAGKAICAQIRRLLEEQKPYGELVRALALAEAGDAVQLFRNGLDDIQARTGPASTLRALSASTESSLARKVFLSFLDAIAQVKEQAAVELTRSLASDSHEPSAALFLAFLQLHGVVRHRINEFTPRHTDFYYRDCLYMAPRPGEPDSVHLVCTRVPTADVEVVIPQRAVFVMRNAAGREIVYRADEDLEVTPVQVAALGTLRLERDELIAPERELDYVTRVKAERLPVVVDDTSGRPGRPYWPLFGGSLHRGAASAARDADLGIAIASPLLFLREGEREVRIRLCFAHPADLDATAAGAVNELAKAAAAARETTELLEKVFERFLQIERQAGADASDEEEVALAGSMAREAGSRIAAKAPGERGRYELCTLYSAFLFQRMLGATDEGVRYRLLGRLFCRWMLLDPEALGSSDMKDIRDALDRIPGNGDRGSTPRSADVLGLLRGVEFAEREYLFGKYIGDLFDISLTAPDGWFSPADAFVTGGDTAEPVAGRGLTMIVRLPPEVPAIVAHNGRIHGGEWQTTLPVLRLRLKPESALFPYSLLADAALTEIHVEVSVRGATDAVLYNNLGRLDPSKPFLPFGPLPARGSYLVFGSAEAARKNVTSLRLNIDWGGLPEEIGGFRSYYVDYGPGFSNEAFRVAPSILYGGHWEPQANGKAQALFTSREDRRVNQSSTLRIDGTSLRNYFRPVRGAAAEEEFRYDVATRSGFFRIVLTEPAGAFGHREYPHVLADVVSRNAKLRRPLPLPGIPYTPLIERLTFDYRASGSMNLAQEDPVERSTSENRVFLVHPFGFEEVYPAIGGASKGAIPRFEHDGNLFIGLAAESAPGRVTLLFSLRDESAHGYAGGGASPRVYWFYLASNQWRPMAPARVLKDSTHGFLTSGIVTLDVPEDIDRSNTILSPDLFWLCACADTGFERFAGLYGVQAQALRATREPVGAGVSAHLPPASGTVAQPLVSIPGLISVVQRGDAFGGRDAESAEQFKTRAGERLRHKNRAAAIWDYERLVLERFPGVFMVKCFPGIGARASIRGGGQPMPRPGCVTVAVVPVPQPGVLEEIRAPKLNAVELERIRDYIRERASPFAQVVVRNAAYERIQVRCAVRLKKGVQSGRSLQRLNQDIVERISPWQPGGLGARFDWVLRPEDVEAWIREFDYVESVARVSLLQISEDDEGYFILGDSARVARAAGSPDDPGDSVRPRSTLRPRLPWSIAVPARRHVVELMTGTASGEAEETGIAVLEIGNTFIVAEGANG